MIHATFKVSVLIYKRKLINDLINFFKGRNLQTSLVFTQSFPWCDIGEA